MNFQEKLKFIEGNFSYNFKDPKLLDLALTHCSCGVPNNERLEFLGDALLGLIISSSLYLKFPLMSEGELSRLRAQLVSGESLAELATELGLPPLLNLGGGELKSNGRWRKSILAGAFEALVGAIYLDGGIEPCRLGIESLFSGRIQQTIPANIPKDPKSKLQEFLQARAQPLPVYTVTNKTGSAHQLEFEVECRVSLLDSPVTAIAHSRKEAEKQAAYKVMSLLDE